MDEVMRRLITILQDLVNAMVAAGPVDNNILHLINEAINLMRRVMQYVH